MVKVRFRIEVRVVFRVLVRVGVIFSAYNLSKYRRPGEDITIHVFLNRIATILQCSKSNCWKFLEFAHSDLLSVTANVCGTLQV